MREVQRTADRIMLHWLQVAGMTLDEWRQLPPEANRDQYLVAEQWVHVPPGAINPDDEAGSVEPFRPAGAGWFYHGSRGWVGPGMSAVKSFNTPSQDLEPDDIYIGPDVVMWRDATGLNEAPVADVVIRRGAGNDIEAVTRKGRP